MMTRKKIFYIVFNNPEGCFPQMDTECETEKEAQDICDKWNAGRDTTYAIYEVASKFVICK